MRIFGSDRIRGIMDRMGMEEGQDIQHPLVTRAISTAQKRVEMQNAAIRQHILKYDNVMNQQREMIYSRRRYIILGGDLKEEVFNTVSAVFDNWLAGYESEDFLSGLRMKLLLKTLITFREDELKGLDKEELLAKINRAARELYGKKEDIIGSDKVRHIERMVMLGIIDMNWKDYLFNIDQLREGINWRAYGQRDPLVEYQHEAFAMFKNFIETIDEEIVERLFKTFAVEEHFTRRVIGTGREKFIHDGFSALAAGSDRGIPAPVSRHEMDLPQETVKRPADKVGRNDPCPCGSGKKYKKCCGK
ncbi:MAG: SEC-C metal-binding domain-containing protein [Candidatus Omnitrophota bacterium]